MIDKVGIKHFHLLDGEQDPAGVIREIGNALQKAPIDVALVGIGENGHLAFNDPPADFETEDPYQVVTPDEACRKQQLGEGWFANLAEVPRQAISMHYERAPASEGRSRMRRRLRSAALCRAWLRDGGAWE